MFIQCTHPLTHQNLNVRELFCHNVCESGSQLCQGQGNLKGEPVVVATFKSHTVSIVPLDLFVAKPAKQFR